MSRAPGALATAGLADPLKVTGSVNDIRITVSYHLDVHHVGGYIRPSTFPFLNFISIEKKKKKVMALKSVLITGCSEGGIGSALALAFQKRNLRVFATARDPSKMVHLSELPNVTLLQLDPTSKSSVEEAAKVVSAKTGGVLDYLINNAGQVMTAPTLDIDIDKAKEMYEINVWGMIRVTQVLSPLVIASRGSIVNISSVSAKLYIPWVGKSSLDILLH